MNKAVFSYTFLRLAQPSTIINMVFFVLAIPTYCVIQLNQASDAPVDFGPIISLAISPIVSMAIAFLFVGSSIGNTKSLDDGEYLSLLFSRPLSRASYIFSKWIAGSILIFALIGLQILYFFFLLYMIGRGAQCSIGLTDIVNLFLNSLGAAGLVVMINAFPAKVGLTIFGALGYCSFIAPMMFGLIPGSTSFLGGEVYKAIEFFCNILRSFIYSPIDVNVYLNSVKIFWLSAFAYVSNIALYLWIAVTVINKREFFYTN